MVEGTRAGRQGRVAAPARTKLLQSTKTHGLAQEFVADLSCQHPAVHPQSDPPDRVDPLSGYKIVYTGAYGYVCRACRTRSPGLINNPDGQPSCS